MNPSSYDVKKIAHVMSLLRLPETGIVPIWYSLLQPAASFGHDCTADISSNHIRCFQDIVKIRLGGHNVVLVEMKGLSEIQLRYLEMDSRCSTAVEFMPHNQQLIDSNHAG